ncbi:DNA-binding protein [Massilia sp. X63]|uniref:DNA-binding protein n=1 Tax=Massilia sp. X63 TaxID=3237285 RepID=UPI0034DDAB33
MARAGLYKSDVQRARDSLISQSIYPSIDAVRTALGNTGSKTTIHKYLKELEDEEGAGPRKVSISSALQDLVERLSSRLYDEAEESVAKAKNVLDRREQEYVHANRLLQDDLSAAREALQSLEAQLDREAESHAETRAALQAEIVARHTAEQQVIGLNERLGENEQHRRSLEEKHAHAREALEHYRQSIKDQRDQDQRRHEQQMHQVQAELRQLQMVVSGKHEEVTRLNQEGARLVAELSHTKQSLYEQQSQGRKMEQTIEQLRTLQQQAVDMERQLVSKTAELEVMTEQLSGVESQMASAKARVHELELQLADANARVQAQEQIGEQLRRYIDNILITPPAAIHPNN